MKHKVRWGLLAGAVGALLVTAGASAGPGRATKPIDPRNLPPGQVISESEVFVMGYWLNGRGHIVKLPARRVVAGNEERVEVLPGAVEAVRAQLPPRDPALDQIQPTPEQKAEFERAVDAEQAKYEPWRANSTAPPPNPGVVPPVPGPTG